MCCYLGTFILLRAKTLGPPLVAWQVEEYFNSSRVSPGHANLRYPSIGQGIPSILRTHVHVHHVPYSCRSRMSNLLHPALAHWRIAWQEDRVSNNKSSSRSRIVSTAAQRGSRSITLSHTIVRATEFNHSRHGKHIISDFPKHKIAAGIYYCVDHFAFDGALVCSNIRT